MSPLSLSEQQEIHRLNRERLLEISESQDD